MIFVVFFIIVFLEYLVVNLMILIFEAISYNKYKPHVSQLKQKSKSELINSVGHLMDMFSKVHETPMTNFASAPVPADFVSEIVPQYQSATFALRNFRYLSYILSLR